MPNGLVTCTILREVSDTTDVDPYPDRIPATGKIIFTKLQGLDKDLTIPAFVGYDPIVGILDSSGIMVTQSDPGYEGVWLSTGVWSVRYELGTGINIAKHIIEVKETHTQENPLNLVVEAPIDPGPNTTVYALIVDSSVNTDDVLIRGSGKAVVGTSISNLTSSVTEPLQSQYEAFTERQEANYNDLLAQLPGQYVGLGEGVIQGSLLSGEPFRVYDRERADSDGMPLFLTAYPADCTEEINAQIADGLSRGVKKFCIKSGTFMMGNVEVPSTCTLEGAGASTFLRPTPGAAAVLIARPRTHVKDMEINLYDEPCVGILGDRASRAQFSNLWINGSNVWTDAVNGSPGTGIRLQGTASNQSAHASMFTNVRASRLEYGIHLASWSYDTQFVDVWIATCKQGMRLNDGGHALSNVHVWESRDSNIYFLGAGGNRLVNCYTEKSYLGWGIFDDTDDHKPSSYTNVYAWRNKAGGIRKHKGAGPSIVSCVANENEGPAFSFNLTTGGVIANSYSGDYREEIVSTTALECSATVKKLLVTNNFFSVDGHLGPLYNINVAADVRLDNNVDYAGSSFARSTSISGNSSEVIKSEVGYAQSLLRSGTHEWGFRGTNTLPELAIRYNNSLIATLTSDKRFVLDGGRLEGGATGLGISTNAGKLGFFGTAPVTKETSVPVTTEAVHAALVRLGLIT